jgi:hypothetical protein
MRNAKFIPVTVQKSCDDRFEKVVVMLQSGFFPAGIEEAENYRALSYWERKHGTKETKELYEY